MKTVWLERLWLVPCLVLAGKSAEGAENLPRTEVLLSVSTATAKGRVVCGLYDRNGWLKRPVQGTKAALKGTTATCHFDGLKPGTYAAGAFQDENSNGKLDRSWTGLPKEPWCVSRGPRGTFGPPSFEAAKFAVTEGTVRMSCSAR
jgi:uncharacterized protein (DUF2141 family)